MRSRSFFHKSTPVISFRHVLRLERLEALGLRGHGVVHQGCKRVPSPCTFSSAILGHAHQNVQDIQENVDNVQVQLDRTFHVVVHLQHVRNAPSIKNQISTEDASSKERDLGCSNASTLADMEGGGSMVANSGKSHSIVGSHFS